MEHLLIQPDLSPATAFLLPLLKLSKISFGQDNLIDTYVTKDDTIIVAVKKGTDVPFSYWDHQYYSTDFDTAEHTAIVLNIPADFTVDYELFKVGMYSHMSKMAKDYIKQYSGLRYKYRVDGPKVNGEWPTVSHLYLKALHKDSDLKEQLEDALAVTLTDDQELLSSIGENAYYQFNPTTNTQ